MSAAPASAPLVKCLLVLDSEGKRVAVKYYGEGAEDLATQQAFEKSLYAKTGRTNARGEAEIVMFDQTIAVYKFVGDCMFFAAGGADENELVLAAVLQALTESISMLVRSGVERRSLLENLDLVLLALDEIVDGGNVLETDAGVVASRVAMRGADDGSSGSGGGGVGEPSFTQVTGRPLRPAVYLLCVCVCVCVWMRGTLADVSLSPSPRVRPMPHLTLKGIRLCT